MNRPSPDQIDALLPQTQCQRCGYPACRPYAVAIAAGSAAINRCPPGGVSGIEGLAALTGQPLIPLDPSCGQAGPIRRALIDEDRCIGCALCLKVCPTDAIIGAFRYLHTVVRDDCTGCELCLSPCPVDCIEMTSLPTDQWGAAEAARARQRFERREERLAPKTQGPQDHQHVLQAALLRAAQRRAP